VKLSAEYWQYHSNATWSLRHNEGQNKFTF